MYLKYLEIQGFKSFPDKTHVSFGHDITSIVGPNGSGKSNISDAIRWVMGEQNSRALRGQKMEDVIFGGTMKRAQVGFAEATLVLDNTDRALSYDADELMVTRRYYRSGESEYYINKQSVRLRDIHELFMDTGLGREGYSNISQGRIDEILALKSTDRREIFEEAAGISKYRHRKEETERRLAHTQDNLLRIGDKISELELQVEPLREQSEKAKKYLAYKAELKGLEVALWLHALQRLSATARKAEEDYNSAAFILEQEHASLEELYALGENLSKELQERDVALDLIRSQIEENESRGQSISSQIAVLQTGIDNCQSNMQRIQEELDEQQSRSGGIETQIRTLQERIDAIGNEESGLRTQLQQAEEEGRKLALSAEGMTRRYLELRNAQEQLRTTLSARQAEMTALEETSQRSKERSAQVHSECEAAQNRRDEAQRQYASTHKALKEAQEEVIASKNTIEGYRLRSQTRAEKRDALQKSLQEADVDLDRLSSRLKLFEEMQRDMEGYSKAVREVTQQGKRGAISGIHGPVSQLIRTDDRFTVAIEIALGSAMQHVIVEDEQCGKICMQMLKRGNVGRATFLPISVIRGKELNEKGVEKCTGFLGIASDLVRAKEVYTPILCFLLGKTVIVEDMNSAISMANRYGHRFRIVTLDGQVLNSGGSMTGGAVSQNTGILSRANEIERLKKQILTEETKRSELKSRYAEALRLTQQVEFELSAEESRLRNAEDEVLRLSGEERQYAVLVQAIGDAIAASESELRSLQERSEADEKHRKQLSEQIAVLNRQISDSEKELSVVSDGQSITSEESNRLSERMTSIRMDLAALDAERITAKDSVANLRGLELAMEGDRSQKLGLLEQYRQDGARLSKETDKLTQTLREQKALTAKKREELEQALDSRRELEAKKTYSEKESQNKSREILNMERESARLEAKKNAAEMEEKQIIDKLWESYELTPSTAADSAAPIESVSVAQKQATDFKRKISSLGTPNLGAIEEFERVNERYTYLTEQRDDVLHSKRDLEGIISDITKQMTEIFTEEFAKINTYFSQTFVEMFGGGKASLELEDPTQPLTCGIEIRVQPPGKQLKTITLLSGGEKAFVAIALYFSILKVRPTPFCMLDEIDAALDDRNVERFANYLRNLSKKTQFIVITHRRGTMEASDVLYGVTMQEQGISKILHLDLNQMEQQIGIIE